MRLHSKKASSDPSLSQYLFKHNFFASANPLEISHLISPNDDEVRMWRHPSATLISRAVLYFRVPIISSYVYS